MGRPTVDNADILGISPSAHNANVGISWIENQVAGLGLIPGDGGAVGALRMSASAVTSFQSRPVSWMPMLS